MKEHPSLDVLEEIQRRVGWLAARVVDAARPDDAKVGGHQEPRAGLISVLTALYFAHLDAHDRVSVKSQDTVVSRAIQYLLGNLDRSSLTEPARTAERDEVDRNATVPLFAALTRRYVDVHFGERPRSRLYSLLGAEDLAEGAVWEAVSDPATAELGSITWVVDVNRRVSNARIDQWAQQFEAAGWHFVEVKYGRLLRKAFEAPGGELLRGWIDMMPPRQYQSLFDLAGAELRGRFLDGSPSGVASLVADFSDDELRRLITDLGSHDLMTLLSTFAECDAEKSRPSVVFTHTAAEQSVLMTNAELDDLRTKAGLDLVTEWDRLDPATAAGQWVVARREHLTRERRARTLSVEVPKRSGVRTGSRPVSTQEAFGRMLTELARLEELAPYLVTASQDVATLAGFVNRVGVFAPTHRRAWNQDPLLTWAEGPDGQHIELGDSTASLFGLLGQLGRSWELSDQSLLPIGTVDDSSVVQGLAALVHAVCSGSRFVLAGTASGTDGNRAHGTAITPSIGTEVPGLTLCEPAYAGALDWMLCDAVGRVAAGENGGYYFRLTSRPLDQAPFDAARVRIGDAIMRRHVVAGAYRLVDASAQVAAGAPEVFLVGAGAVLPDVLAAAAELSDEGIAAHVVDVTSPDRLYTAWQLAMRHGVRTATAPSTPGVLRTAFGAPAPLVTVHDAASHSMAWLGSALGVPAVPLGVDADGESGCVHDRSEAHDLLPGSIVNGALAALSLP